MARPVIALLTDFGLRDHYVAAMKGVMLGICPEATFVDISHDIPPQDILAGALELEAVTPYLPAHTVVVAVVDPGVGSARRAIALESDGRRFVGPDNGLFSLVGPADRAVALARPAYALQGPARTFEGRDRFAPAAAWLAGGLALDALGPAVRDLVTLDLPPMHAGADAIDGSVLRIDRFGNLVTNIPREAVAALAPPLRVTVLGVTIEHLSQTYADVPPGAWCALVGSTGRLEISLNGASAAVRLGAARGAAVQVRGPNPRDTMPGAHDRLRA